MGLKCQLLVISNAAQGATVDVYVISNTAQGATVDIYKYIMCCTV